MSERIYDGGHYLLSGGYTIPGSNQLGCGSIPILLERARSNDLAYNPELVLAPDAITDGCGRMAAFCIDGYPVWGYAEPKEVRVADLGTGSGIFLTGTINGLKIPTDKTLKIHAIDNDPNALDQARSNISVATARAPRPIEAFFENADYCKGLRGNYDVIYFNPPYLEEGEDMSYDEAKLAPRKAVYSSNPLQEYDRVVPYLNDHLETEGIALVRLPRENARIDAWLTDFLNHNDNARLLLIEAGSNGRQGRIMAIVKDVFPSAFSEYRYWENYIGASRDERKRFERDPVRIYHDADCEVRRLSRERGIQLLGGQALATIQDLRPE